MNSIYKVVIAIFMSLALLPVSYARPGAVSRSGVMKRQEKQFRAKNHKRTTVNQVDKDVRSNNSGKSFLEKLQDNQQATAKNAFSNVMDSLSSPIRVKRVSKKEVGEAVKVLNKTVQMDEKTVRHLHQVAGNHKYIASALVNLAKNKDVVNKTDMRTALQFVSQMSKVNPVATSVIGSGEAVLLAIGSRVDEIVTQWSGAEKTSVMDFMNTYMKMVSGSVGPAAAVDATLKARGYETVEQRQQRLEEITKGCKKAA